ncbi:MAG: aminotransferase class V-fold PLP-dependent enzyme [Clostridia bacterium]|nr:aminotransferase class V-fold PLP-dependent enzyme [Clostridia bacterium]
MIYFDNAATGGFKPSAVTESVFSAVKYLCANPSRSSHKLAYLAGDCVYKTRSKLSSFFNAVSPSHVVFTKNCTEALNTAILGSNVKGEVLTTVFEHNSVLRPLYYLEKKGDITIKIIEPENGRFITASDVIKNFSSRTKMVIVSGASNVTGEVNEIEKIGAFLKDKNAVYLVDGAQLGGHYPIDVQRFNIDYLCLACHKGLYSIMGLGALIFSSKVKPLPLTMGGTGTETFNLNQPDVYPERLESGTLNLPAICSLEEGLLYLEKNADFIREYLTNLTDYLTVKLCEISGVTVYTRKNPVGITAFSIAGIDSNEVSELLSSKYDIAVRGGFHCAPLTHKFLNTQDSGLVRASICPHNTKREVNALISAIKDISAR